MEIKKDTQLRWDTQSDRILYIRSHILNMTRQDFCNASNIPHTSMVKWENLSENKHLTNQSVDRLLQAFSNLDIICNKDWLLRGIGEPPYKVSQQKIISLNKKNVPLTYKDKSEDSDYFTLLNNLHNFFENPSVLIHTGQAMLPIFKSGDIVIGQKYTHEDIRIKCLDKPCIIQTKDNLKILRKVSLGQTDTSFILSPFNPECIEETIEAELVFAAPVLWHRHKI